MFHALVGAEAAWRKAATAYTPKCLHLRDHVPQLLLRVHKVAAPHTHQGHDVRRLGQRRADECWRWRETAAMQRRARADFDS